MPDGSRRAPGAEGSAGAEPAAPGSSRPGGYAGEDRRRVGRRLAPDSRARQIVLAAAVGAVATSRMALTGVDGGDRAAAGIAALAVVVELALGAAAAFVLWRGSGRATVGAAAGALSVLALEATGLPALGLDLVPGRPAGSAAVATAAGAGAAAALLLGRRASGPAVDASFRLRHDLPLALAAGGLLLVIVPLGGLHPFVAVLIAAALVGVVTRGRAARVALAFAAGAALAFVAAEAGVGIGIVGTAALAIVAAAVPLGWALTEIASAVAGERGQALDTEVRLAHLASSAASEREAIEERDHDVLSALVALEGGLRALRPVPEVAATDDPEPDILLLDALAVELSAARGLLAPHARPAQVRPFAVDDLLRAQVHAESSRGALVDLDADRGLWAMGSPERTAQVVRNLLDNAARHAPGAPVRVSAWREGDRIRVRVRDDGPGIPRADRARVFERRGRATTAAAEGSGLGLFVASRLMADQHGDLVLEDRERGTAFLLTLPAAGERAEVA